MWNSVTPGDAATAWLVESTVCPVWNVHFAVSIVFGAVFSVYTDAMMLSLTPKLERGASTRLSAPTELPSSILVTAGCAGGGGGVIVSAGGGGGASFLHAVPSSGAASRASANKVRVVFMCCSSPLQASGMVRT